MPYLSLSAISQIQSFGQVGIHYRAAAWMSVITLCMLAVPAALAFIYEMLSDRDQARLADIVPFKALQGKRIGEPIEREKHSRAA